MDFMMFLGLRWIFFFDYLVTVSFDLLEFSTRTLRFVREANNEALEARKSSFSDNPYK